MAKKKKKGDKATFGIGNTWEAGGVVEIPEVGGKKKDAKPAKKPAKKK